jgi:signal peptidase I
MYEVQGVSMSPDLPDGSRVVVNKLAYRSADHGWLSWLPLSGDPQPGDLIVFHDPRSPHRDLVKRVIGLPGQTVVIDEATGHVLVDGHQLDEPYAVSATLCRGKCRWTVPEESYFVLGDNRAVSDDSRLGWFVAAEDIIGKVLLEF